MGIEATCHLCANRWIFSEYHIIDNEKQSFIGNALSSRVVGQENVVLKLTNEKNLTLNDVFHTLKVQMNLIFDIGFSSYLLESSNI